MQAGFSVADINYLDDNLDIRNRLEIQRGIQRQKEIDLILTKLSISEAVMMANSLQNKKNRNSYLRWRNKNVARIRKLLGQKRVDGWSKVAGRSKRL